MKHKENLSLEDRGQHWREIILQHLQEENLKGISQAFAVLDEKTGGVIEEVFKDGKLINAVADAILFRLTRKIRTTFPSLEEKKSFEKLCAEDLNSISKNLIDIEDSFADVAFVAFIVVNFCTRTNLFEWKSIVDRGYVVKNVDSKKGCLEIFARICRHYKK